MPNAILGLTAMSFFRSEGDSAISRDGTFIAELQRSKSGDLLAALQHEGRVMHRVETKLAQWKNRYLALGAAHRALGIAVCEAADAATIEALKTDVERLQEETAAALEAVRIQIETDKPRASADGTRLVSQGRRELTQ
jgi:hypothetical protein